MIHVQKEKEGASSKSESKATVEDDSPPQSSSLEEASVNTPATQTSSEAKEEKEEEDKVTTTRQAEESSSEECSTTAMREEENKSEKGESTAPSSDKTGRSSSSSKLVFSSSGPSRPLPPTTTLSRATNIAAMSASLVTGPSGLIGTQNLNQQVSPHPQLPPQPQREGSELQMSSDVLSLETPSIAEKKEVGPEIPGSEEEEELPSKLSMLKGSVQLDKELNTSELEGKRVVVSLSLSYSFLPFSHPLSPSFRSPSFLPSLSPSLSLSPPFTLSPSSFNTCSPPQITQR